MPNITLIHRYPLKTLDVACRPSGAVSLMLRSTDDLDPEGRHSGGC